VTEHIEQEKAINKEVQRRQVIIEIFRSGVLRTNQGHAS
jgi:hypothetical protein